MPSMNTWYNDATLRFQMERECLYNLRRLDGTLVGNGKWKPMTHHEALVARSKFSDRDSIRLEEAD
jgi:hypothetical protein